jgi:hypothetical protein
MKDLCKKEGSSMKILSKDKVERVLDKLGLGSVVTGWSGRSSGSLSSFGIQHELWAKVIRNTINIIANTRPQLFSLT